jgi:hypothetical protein
MEVFVGHEASHIVLIPCLDYTELPRDSRDVVSTIHFPKYYEMGMKYLTDLKKLQ